MNYKMVFTFQELMKGVNQVEVSSNPYDATLLAAQVLSIVAKLLQSGKLDGAPLLCEGTLIGSL